MSEHEDRERAIEVVVTYAPDDDELRHRQVLAALFLLDRRAEREAGDRQDDHN